MTDDQHEEIVRRHRRTTWTAALSAGAALVVILGASLAAITWVFKPVIIETLERALQPYVQHQVGFQMRPLGEAFKEILRGDIERLRREIVILNQRLLRDDLSDVELRDLENKRIELEAKTKAMAKLS